MLSQVSNEVLKIVKHFLVRCAAAAKKTVSHQNRSTLFADFLDSSKLFGRGNLLSVTSPFIGFDAITGFEFKFRCHVAYRPSLSDPARNYNQSAMVVSFRAGNPIILASDPSDLLNEAASRRGSKVLVGSGVLFSGWVGDFHLRSVG